LRAWLCLSWPYCGAGEAESRQRRTVYTRSSAALSVTRIHGARVMDHTGRNTASHAITGITTERIAPPNHMKRSCAAHARSRRRTERLSAQQPRHVPVREPDVVSLERHHHEQDQRELPAQPPGGHQHVPRLEQPEAVRAIHTRREQYEDRRVLQPHHVEEPPAHPVVAARELRIRHVLPALEPRDDHEPIRAQRARAPYGEAAEVDPAEPGVGAGHSRPSQSHAVAALQITNDAIVTATVAISAGVESMTAAADIALVAVHSTHCRWHSARGYAGVR